MGEIKSVKVDNWGVFFLQKLQNFFNKTDYCDLTLQFRDNSQLKVHRLVLSACTDYFNVLEQTCEVIDDAIIMPNELQADVVVPIVNFMYTGTLEFELRMYNRLLRTAREMNMTVLLKLLEAHRRTMELHPQKTQGTSSPKLRRRVVQTNSGTNTQFKNVANSPTSSNARLPTAPSSAVTVQRRILPASTNTIRMTQNASANSISIMGRQTSAVASNVNTVTYTRIKQENIETNANTASSVGYGGKSSLQQSSIGPSSTFEQLRKSYNNNKRPATATFISPPAKKPNLEDVKEFAEQQRMRKQIAAEYGDTDGDYDGALMDDDIHNDDDDDDVSGNQSSFHPNSNAANVHGSSSSAVPTSKTEASSVATTTTTTMANDKSSTIDPPGTTTITVKHEGPDKPPTIVVKDSSNSKMNHAKIISEVLRQYPHLIKSNKNIKLKIMPNTNLTSGTNTSATSNNTSTNQKIIVRKDIASSSGVVESSNVQQQQLSRLQQHSTEQAAVKVSPTTTSGKGATATGITSTTISSTSAGTNTISPIQKQQQQQRNVSTTNAQQRMKLEGSSSVTSATTATTATSTGSATTSGQQTQKRRIDSKTMHALIALGAENTTGPWLCLRCGRNGHPISIPSYRGFRRHLINTHKETIDPDLCEYCGWRSSGKRELHFHMQLEHKVKTSLYIFPECQLCEQMCIDSDALNQHLIDIHPDENKQQCIYCNKIFPEEVQLYIHIKTYHKKQALDDGIIDYSDDEAEKQQEQQNLYQELIGEFISTNDRGVFKVEDDKIKILSDISLPSTSSITKHEVSTTPSTANKATAVATKSATALSTASSTTTKTIESAETYLHHADTETKFVTADGSEVILTDEQRKEILSQLNQEHEGGGVVMVLSEQQSEQLGAISHDDTSQATSETNEEPMEHDDSHIYDEMKSLSQRATSVSSAAAGATAIKAPVDDDEDDGEEDEDENENDDEGDLEEELREMHEHEEEEHTTNEAKETDGGHHRHRSHHHKNNTPIDENKESLDNLEWAENVISQHELADKAKTTASSHKKSMDIDNNKMSNNKHSDEAESSKKERKDVVPLHPDEISRKLKELTGDWSDDDIEEDMSADEMLMDTEKKSDMIADIEKKEKTIVSPLTTVAMAPTTPAAKTKTMAVKSTEDSNVKVSEQLAEMDTEMLELAGIKADTKVKDDQTVKAVKNDKIDEKSIQVEKAKIESYDKTDDDDDNNDNDSDEYDNNDMEDNDNDDDDEDDIDLALRSLHKGIEPDSSSPIKDHNISDELESLQVKLTNEVTSIEEHHNEHDDNDSTNDDIGNDNDNDDNDEDDDRTDYHSVDEGDVKEKKILDSSKRAISPKLADTTLKKNDLIEMLINDAEICSDDTPLTTASTVTDNVAITTNATTTTKANVSTTLKNSPVSTIKIRKEEQVSETETKIETESELNTNNPTQSDVNLEEKEECVPSVADVVVSSILSTNESKTKSVECTEIKKNTFTKSSDGGDCGDSNVPMPSSTTTTEDRVKSLMREWGEDEDDDDDDIDHDDEDDDMDDETKNL